MRIDQGSEVRKKIILWAAVLSFLFILPAGCSKPQSGEDGAASRKASSHAEEKGQTDHPKFFKGMSLSPRSYEGSDFTTFFEKVKESGDIIRWAGNWNEFAKAEDNSAGAVMGLSSRYGLIPLIETEFFTPEESRRFAMLDEESIRRFEAIAVEFAEENKPPYLSFGVEINSRLHDSPEAMKNYALLFDRVYDKVKKASPDSILFITFQLEKMKGMDGGLFGGDGEAMKPQWHILDLFSKSDMIGFTTYPCLVYKNPQDIPQDYYTEIARYTDKPVAFTEVGWFSEAGLEEWESSLEEQAEFIPLFFELIGNLDQEMVIWSFLYDRKIQRPFDTMGLYDKDGNSKPAWEKWLHAGRVP